MEDYEAGYADGADTGRVVSIEKHWRRVKREKDSVVGKGLHEAHGEDSCQDEFLRLASSQAPEDRYWLLSVPALAFCS